MRKLTLFLVAVLFTTITMAQKTKHNDIPEAVKSAFQKQFPNAKEVEWETEDGNFEVEFDLNEVDYSVLYNASGSLLETEVEIELKQLPAGVLDYISANYKGAKVKEAAKIMDANGVVTYEAEIKGKDIIFDNNGKFIKEIKD